MLGRCGSFEKARISRRDSACRPPHRTSHLPLPGLHRNPTQQSKSSSHRSSARPQQCVRIESAAGKPQRRRPHQRRLPPWVQRSFFLRHRLRRRRRFLFLLPSTSATDARPMSPVSAPPIPIPKPNRRRVQASKRSLSMTSSPRVGRRHRDAIRQARSLLPRRQSCPRAPLDASRRFARGAATHGMAWNHPATSPSRVLRKAEQCSHHPWGLRIVFQPHREANHRRRRPPWDRRKAGSRHPSCSDGTDHRRSNTRRCRSWCDRRLSRRCWSCNGPSAHRTR